MSVSTPRPLHTSRAEADAASPDSAEFFRALNENSSDLMIVADADATVRYLGPSVTRLFGYAPADLVGRSIFDLVHPDDRARVHTDFANGISHPGAGTSVEFRVRRADGEWRVVEAISNNQLDNPLVAGVIVNARDITERKQMERERERLLAESEAARARLVNILESVSDGFVAFDRDMNYAYVNARAGELLGRAPADLVGKNYWEEYPEARGTPFANAYLRALQTQTPIVFEDYYAPWDRWFENRIYPSAEGLTIFFTEITERKKAERALRELQERLTLAVRSGNVGLWDWDLRTNQVYYSPEWKSQLGYAEDEISNDYEEWVKRLHPDDAERAVFTTNAYIANPYPNYHSEFRMQHKDGSYRWILVQADLLTDAQGKPYRMLGSHIDITKSKQAEAALSRERDLLQTLMDNIPDAIFFKDTASRFVRINRAHAQILGVADPLDALGKTDADFHAAAPAQEFLADERAVLTSGVSIVDKTEFNPTADGQPRWFSATKVPLRDQAGQITGLVGVSRDLTERKRAVEALAQTLDRLERAEAYAQMGSWEFDVATKEGWWSKQMYHLVAIDPAGGFPTLEAYLDSIHPEDRNLVLDAYVRMSEGNSVIPEEFRSNPERGPLRHLLTTVHREMDAAGKPAKYFGTVLDITARKRAEDEIRKLNAELEQRVFERTAQLQAANKELESFSYSVSHDLRAPLRAISGFAQIIARRHRAALNAEGQHYVDNIVQASERMGHLIDDLLNYSRLGRAGVRHDAIRLRDVLTPLANELASRLASIGGTLDIAADLPTVLGDKTLLTQIFSNLFENAVTYRKPDIPLQLDVSAESRSNHVVVRVRDNGIGIAPEHQEKIFNLFQRLHGEDEYPGTGIGLATVKKAVELLGGAVWVESIEGEGSTFCVELFHA